MINGNKTALFNAIGAVSFAMDELRLYLDTHPDSTDALSAFSEKMQKRAELTDEYTEKYGPLDSYYFNVDNGYTWTNAPIPWDKEANA